MPLIETLIIRKHSDLEELGPYVGTSLKTLDVSDCPKLQRLGTLNDAKTLRNLNVSGCSMLGPSAVSGIINGSPLEVLKMDDYKDDAGFVISGMNTANLVELSAKNCATMSSFSIRSAHHLQKVDLRNNQYMRQAIIEDAPLLTELDLSGCVSIGELWVTKTPLTSLRIDKSTELKSIDLRNTALASLNLDNQKGLERACVADNPSFTSLSVSGVKSLIDLVCYNNKLLELNMTGCDNLENLDCRSNELRELDLRNFAKLKEVSCSSNESLKLSLGSCAGLAKLDCAGCGLTELNVRGATALQELNFDSNHISEINLADCSQLTVLRCGANQLKTLDISHCTLLKELWLYDNQLTELDLGNCTQLQSLDCSNNQLNELNVLGCSLLSYLDCSRNKIQELNLKGLSLLTSLYYSGNPISILNISGTGMTMVTSDGRWGDYPFESIDISNTAISSFNISTPTLKLLNVDGCSQLKSLYVSDTQITSLEISTCGNLTKLDCSDNASLSKLVMSERNSTLQELSAINTKITSVIYDWLKPSSFYYHERYGYYEEVVDGETVINYIDSGYGWWYPGEPNRGYHKK